MKRVAAQRSDVIVALDHPAIPWDRIEPSFDILDAQGFIVSCHDAPTEQMLARVDLHIKGSVGPQLAGGGVILVERWGIRDIVACVGYGGAIAEAKRLAPYAGDPELCIVGPFGGQVGIGEAWPVLLLAALRGAKARGARRALLPGLRASAVDTLRTVVGAALVEQVSLPEPPVARVVICASGFGSLLQAVADAIGTGRLPFEIVRVVVDKANCYALERAKRARFETSVVLWDRAQESREHYDARVADTLQAPRADAVLLLGWMHILSAETLAGIADTINIHPAYLPLDPQHDDVVMPDGTRQPAFRGMHALEQAVEAGASWIGTTVHRVTPDLDRGPVLAREPIKLIPGEDPNHRLLRVHRISERGVLLSGLERWNDERRVATI